MNLSDIIDTRNVIQWQSNAIVTTKATVYCKFIANFTESINQYICHQTLENTALRLFAAPLQGYTDAEWRHCHAEMAGGVDAYYTPFMRVKKGAVRGRDLRGLRSTLNSNHHLVPQILVCDVAEMRLLTDAIVAEGYDEVDINMGCPFAPQVKHGRGAALLAAPETLHAIGCEMRERYPDMRFSVKMRLGINDPSQWRDIIGEIDAMPLTHLTVHPRTASQQYAGDLHMDEFASLLHATRHPVVYNGNVTSPQDIDRIAQAYPTLHGIMAGRGLLMRPTLFAEWRTGSGLTERERLVTVLRIHDAIYRSYQERLCGDAQILSKIKPFWDYLEDTIDRKTAKAIRKATSLPKYEAAIAALR